MKTSTIQVLSLIVSLRPQNKELENDSKNQDKNDISIEKYKGNQLGLIKLSIYKEDKIEGEDESLEGTYEELQIKLQTLQTDYDKISHQNKELIEKNIVLKKEVNNLSSQIRILKINRESMYSRRDRLQKELQETNETIHCLNDKIDNEDLQITSLEDENKELKDRNIILEAQLKEVESELQSYNEKYSQLSKDLKNVNVQSKCVLSQHNNSADIILNENQESLYKNDEYESLYNQVLELKETSEKLDKELKTKKSKLFYF